MQSDLVEAVARAIDAARCPDREGPYGGYDYGYNEAFYGPAPEAGRYVVRDFRDPKSDSWGRWVYQTDDREEYESAFERLTRHHIAQAAIAATLDHVERHLSDCDPDALERLRELRG